MQMRTAGVNPTARLNYRARVITVRSERSTDTRRTRVRRWDKQQIMMTCLSVLYTLIFLLVADVNAVGIGEAWQVTPQTKPVYPVDPGLSRTRLDSSAFEVRTVTGVGRLADEAEKDPVSTTPSALPEVTTRRNRELEYLRRFFENSSYDDDDEVGDNIRGDSPSVQALEKMLKKTLIIRLLRVLKKDEDYNEDNDDDDDDDDNANLDEETPVETTARARRFRRQADNETSMEKISTTKSVREARLNSPGTWSTSAQPVSVEIRHRIPLDQVVQQQQQEEEEAAAAAALANSYRRYPQPPRVDFVTGHHHRRGYPEYRESRDMPLAGRGYDDYEQISWYRNALRDRDYDPLSYPSYRRGYTYQYPDRYRTERDYYVRPPSDPYYYPYDRYDRYRDDEMDRYAHQRSMPKPRRVIYYATLPEVVRKPVDLRNYPRGSPYDAGAVKSPSTRDDTYKRVPGNVDPGKYRYKNAYSSYDPHAKRSSYHDRDYGYAATEELRRVRLSTKENLKNGEGFGADNDEQRRVSNLVAIRDGDGGGDKLPWPVQIGTAVSIKNDERITGRKVFGEPGYERYQKAPDTTGSSELQSDN